LPSLQLQYLFTFIIFLNQQSTSRKKHNINNFTSSNPEQIIEISKQETVVNTSNSKIETKKENQVTVSEPIQQQEPVLNESPKSSNSINKL
jgi:hypothetical protein